MKAFSVLQYGEDYTVLGETNASQNGFFAVHEQTQPQGEWGLKTQAVLSVHKKIPHRAAVRLVLEESEGKADYIFAPAALYRGNRFKSLPKPYPPMLTKEEARLYKGQTVLSDVPRLKEEGGGCAQLNAGDLSIPCVGYYSAEKSMGYLVFFEQGNEWGNFGVTIQEGADSKSVTFILSSPCVRMPEKYAMCTTHEKSDDMAAVLREGDHITFSYCEYRFPCGSVCEFLNQFFQYRQHNTLPRSHPNRVPWHYAFELIEQKYNHRNWQAEFGFYTSSEAKSGIFRQWQTGWVGGAMNTLPGLLIGGEETKEKSRRTLDFVFQTLQHTSGFLYGIFCDGQVYGDDLKPENKQIVMSRKNADALYYIAKLLLLLREKGDQFPEIWWDGLKRLADAFILFYEKNGEIGQFIDIKRGKPYVSGSASGGLVCGGLVLCATLFDKESYLETASRIGECYYRDYIAKGFSTGGPGEILSCPDSESAFALLESYVLLYRSTHLRKWLGYAKDTASLCASWCVGYDYAYRSDTQLFARGVATTGAVWASVQNKHAAPGICTMSGESLLHLYRATGNLAYLELLKDISHNITQYVSTPEQPIYASYVWHNGPAHLHKLMIRQYVRLLTALSSKSRGLKKLLAPLHDAICNPVGRINERVNLSDWEGTNNVGEIPLGSCWCEVSAMLTYLEIPAVYIQPDTGLCFTMDHITCSIQSKSEQALTLVLHNPTEYGAAYRIFIEDSASAGCPMPPGNALPVQTIFLKSGETLQISCNRRGSYV